jgi:hypothetical protein
MIKIRLAVVCDVFTVAVSAAVNGFENRHAE